MKLAMIFSNTFQRAISNLGWVDKGGLWIYDCHTGAHSLCRLYDANYLSVTPGNWDYFSVVHIFNTKIIISVHHFSEPNKVVCQSVFNEFNTHVEGDLSYFNYVPQYYVVGFSINDQFGFNLVNISNGLIKIDNDKLEWYRNGNFDFMWQGLTGVTAFGDKLIFTVQRSGMLFLFDVKKNALIDSVALAGRHGNPGIIVTEHGIIASDYDTLLFIDSEWKVKLSTPLQPPLNGTGQFVGQISRSSNHESLFTVARPFSGDILVLDNDFRIKGICTTGKQPLEAVLTTNRNVIARDWQTGDLLRGEMENAGDTA